MEVGAAGTIMPPVEGLLSTARRNEEKGYDSIWWPDHLMGWYPESIWTPDVTPLAQFQPSPHVFLDPIAAIAAVAVHTERILLGTSVTEPIRRHPAQVAAEWLSLQHLSKGRAILGIGAGEGENILPYGIDYDRPVGKFEEALQVIRLLWESDEPVSFEGSRFSLDRAVLGLGPYEGAYPPIWIGAHGPRMLEITGRYGDGWLPGLTGGAETYGERLGVIRRAAEAAGRDPDAITPGLYAYSVVAEDHEETHRLLEHPLLAGNQLVLPSEAFEERGFAHPFGSGFYGIKDYIPTHYSKDEALKAIASIPFEITHDYVLHGTPDELVGVVREHEAAGLRHVVLWNMTFLGDPTKIRESFHLMDEVRAALAT
jgi:phthiodiolone/phenolphthiodiolone dimycocerosates ketoreductase